ncbi:MAG: SDR family NAD(P)-dependent oxidoreductase [Pseudomonas sp.]|uniref:SDR family NAD(P)-dependent oxidoreductase n=1 Tax=unclassified Pseudomonas TaxID=196821 RepID=UPI000731820E|nr:SDR family oxidoreductase [Pseudomonas sp. L5B5]KTC37798.1 short-chain dehydrogenase [Pseudomonas sp. ABAC61]UCZ85375.1 SDR family oxidoreductase [Pseudomonas sp. L5B5]
MLILVTGTRTGLGRMLVKHLIGEGHTVIGCSRREGARMPPGYIHFNLDLTDPKSVTAMFHEIRKRYGFIDALVNNAGTSIMEPFLLSDMEHTKKLYDLNVFSVMQCCREAVKLLKNSSSGSASILNISSVATLFSLEGQLAYATSKAAIEQFTRSLSREIAPLNIRVNTLGLPPLRTALTRTLGKDKVEALIARQAIKRPCEFPDVVGPVEFFLSGASSFVSGETLYLGGVR